MTEQQAQVTIRKPAINFTQVPNEILSSNLLSWKAKGMYAYLLSKPDGWQFHPKAILKEGVGGKRLLNSAIRELVEKKCIERVIKRTPDGRITSVEYRFSLKCGFATEAKCNRSKKAPDRKMDLISNTDKVNNTEPPISPKGDKCVQESVNILSKMLRYHTGREQITDRWYSSLHRWLLRNKIDSSRLLAVLKLYYGNLKVDDDYMPKVRSLGELREKFNCLEDYFTDRGEL